MMMTTTLTRTRHLPWKRATMTLAAKRTLMRNTATIPMSATRRVTVAKSWAATRAVEKIGAIWRRKQLRMIGIEVVMRRMRLAGEARAAVEEVVVAAQLGERRKDEINKRRRREGTGMSRRALRSTRVTNMGGVLRRRGEMITRGKTGRGTGVTHTTRALTRAQRNTRAVTEQPHFVMFKTNCASLHLGTLDLSSNNLRVCHSMC